MLARFRRIFKPPTLEDPEQAIQAQNLHKILIATIMLASVYFVWSIFTSLREQALIPFIVILVELGLLILLQYGRIRLASWIFTSLLWLAILSEVILYGGIRDTGYAAFAIAIVIAGLTMGVQVGIFFTALTILAGAFLSFAEGSGFLPDYAPVTSSEVLISYTITFSSITLLLYLAIHSITTASRKATANEHAQLEINKLLEENQLELEQRTITLEKSNLTLQTFADISRLISQAKTENELMENTVHVLSAKTNSKHVAIYLLDKVEESAILRSTNSQEGKKRLSEGYQLNVNRSDFAFVLRGAELLHYFVADSNYYIDRPELLPDMKVNQCFPMVSGNHLVGLVNLQNTATDMEILDQQTMQTIADHIALSIENIQLLDQLHTRVQEVDTLAGQTISSAWMELSGGESIGYLYDRLQILQASESIPEEIIKNLMAGKPVSYMTSDVPARARLLAPIILRENVIGIIGYEDNDLHHEWQEDEKALLETVASRVSLSLENTRLVAEAQLRANRESIISQVTSRMRETLDIDTILKTAVQEIRQSLDLREAEIRLQTLEPTRRSEK